MCKLVFNQLVCHTKIFNFKDSFNPYLAGTQLVSGVLDGSRQTCLSPDVLTLSVNVFSSWPLFLREFLNS